MDAAQLALLPQNGFPVRRALERLREGLYDPLAVRLLSGQQQELDRRVSADLQRLAAGHTVHLCVCGAYGQGKSHTLTYLHERLRAQGYAVSLVNLDPREAPLHQYRQVYRSLVETLVFPAGAHGAPPPGSLTTAWQRWTSTQNLPEDDRSAALARLLPADMPHPFKAVLVALAQPTRPVPVGKRRLRAYRDYRPMQFPALLQRALVGEAVPVFRLRPVLKYHQVDFYRQASLMLRGVEPFIRMTWALARLFVQMGYKGWALLFDEAEAVTQVRSTLRAQSYRILHQILYPPVPTPGFYPVVAVTPDFFQQLRAEDYDLPYFDRDYADVWRDLSVYPLQSLTRPVWQRLCDTLVALHTLAYHWNTDSDRLRQRLYDRLDALPLEDTRTALKGLVDELDQRHQDVFFAQSRTAEG